MGLGTGMGDVMRSIYGRGCGGIDLWMLADGVARLVIMWEMRRRIRLGEERHGVTGHDDSFQLRWATIAGGRRITRREGGQGGERGKIVNMLRTPSCVTR